MNSTDKFDQKLVCFLVLISVIFIYSIHDASATSTTVIKNYAATTTLSCTTGSSGGSNGNNLCFEEYSGLPAGHRIITGGFDGQLTYNGQQIKEYLYLDDGAIMHILNQTHNYLVSPTNCQCSYAEEFTGLPAGKTIRQIGSYLLTGGGAGCTTEFPLQANMAIYSDLSGSPSSLLWGGASQQTPCSPVTSPTYWSPNIVVPASGNVWIALEFSSPPNGSYDGLFYYQTAGGGVTSTTGTFGCCSFPNSWGTTGVGTIAPYMIIKYNDQNITGYPKTRFDTSANTIMNQGVNTVTFPNNATVPQNGNVWLGIFGQHASDNSNVYGAMFANTTGIPAGKVVAFNNGDNGLPYTFAFDATQLTNSTVAPYSSLSFSNANLVLSPTSGNVGSTVTASGSGFKNATLASASQLVTGSPATFFGGVNVKQFTGLPAGAKITQVGQDITDNGSGTVTNNNGLTGSTTTASGSVICAQITSLPSDGLTTITSANFNIVSGTGNVRVKIYNDTSNTPSNLLGESGSTAVSTTGTLSFPVTATIPTSGVVWSCVEADTGAINFNAGTFQTVGLHVRSGAHTYGSGPNPFGAATSINSFFAGITYHDTTTPHFKFKFYTDNSNTPNTLINESASLPVTATGFQNFTATAIIPSNGIIWVGLETDSASIKTQNLGSQTVQLNQRIGHTYGSGPNPFGAGAATNAFWEKITYINNPITLKWDGTTLTTNPTTINADTSGAFSGVIFNVPSSSGGPHTVNATDGSDWSTAQFSTNAQYSVSLKPMLHDNSVQITSGKLIVTQNGITIGTANTNTTGWTSVSGLSGGNYNFTIMDDKNFAVYKELNTNVASNIAKTVSTYDTPFNCISSATGYQSDFILRINDTDGTHITNITTPTCPNQSQVIFNMTFTGNGQSGATFSSMMITTVGVQTYSANPQNFTVSGTVVPTVFTQGNNIFSNSFAIGSGTATTIKQFIISLTKTQSTNLGTGGGASPNLNPNPIPSNPCPTNYEFDSISQTCIIINQQNLPPASTVCDPNHVAQGFLDINGVCTAPTNIVSIPIDCGGPNVTIVSIVMPPEAYYQPILTPPFQYSCPSNSTTIPIVAPPPNSCPVGETLQNDGTCAFTIPPVPSTCPADPLSCLLVTPPPDQLQVTAKKADGTISVITTSLPSLQSPQLTNLAWLIIFVILFAVIGGYIYRKYLQNNQKKGNKKSTKKRDGTSGSIAEYNKRLAREFNGKK